MLIRSRFFISLSFSALLLATTFAQAQRPALTKSVDEPGRNPYSEAASVICGGNACTVLFPVVPAGFRLVVTHVSITYFAQDSLPDTASLRQSLTGNYEYLPAMSATRNLQYGVSAMVTYYVEPGSQPEILVHDSVPGSTAFGSVNGYVVAIP